MRLVLMTVILLGATDVVAQPADKAAAQALFEEGRRLLDKGDAAGACVKFEASARLEPAPGTTLNLARCNEELGRVATAWALYLEVRDRSASHAKRAAFATQRANALAKRLPKLTFRIVAPVPGLVIKRDGVPVDGALLSSRIPVDPGPRTIEASAPGYLTWSATVDAAEGVVVEVEVSALKPVPEAPVDAMRDSSPSSDDAGAAGANGDTPGPHHVARSNDDARAASVGGGRRKLGLALGGGGVVALGVGLTFGAMARSTWSDALDHCDDRGACDAQGLALEAQARDKATLSTVLVGAGLAATGAGVFLYLTAPRTRAVVAPTPGGDGATVTFLGSF